MRDMRCDPIVLAKKKFLALSSVKRQIGKYFFYCVRPVTDRPRDLAHSNITTSASALDGIIIILVGFGEPVPYCVLCGLARYTLKCPHHRRALLHATR